jgi:DnaA initiator-associating protein
MDQQIFKHFQNVIETTMTVGDAFAEPMAAAAEKISNALIAGNTIFSCGDKSAVLLAQLFTDYLAQGYEIERPGFPALNINKLVDNSFGAERYSNCIQVQGNSADVLLVISAGDNSLALITSIEAAIEKEMSIILLAGANDDLLSATLGYNDVSIPAAEFKGQLSTAAQFQIVQCLCALVDHQIFGGE